MNTATLKHLSQAIDFGSHKGEGGELFDAYDDNTALTDNKYMSRSSKAMMAFARLMHDNDSSEDEAEQQGQEQDRTRASASGRPKGVIGGIAGVSRYSMRDADKESGDEEENRESRSSTSSPNRRPSRRPSQMVTRESLLSNRPSTSIVADVTFMRSNEAFRRRASTLQQQQQQQSPQQSTGSGSARVMPPRASTYNKWHAEVESPWVGGASSSHSRNNSISNQKQIPFSSPSPSAIKTSSAKKATIAKDNSTNDDVDASPTSNSSTSSPSTNTTGSTSLSTTSSTSSLMMMNSNTFSAHAHHLSVVNEASNEEDGRSSSPSFERSASPSLIEESTSGKEEWERTAAHKPPPSTAVDRIPSKVEENKGGRV